MSTNELKLIQVLTDNLNDDIKYHQKLIKKHQKAIEKKKQKISDLLNIEANERSIQYTASEGCGESRIDEDFESDAVDTSLNFNEGFEEMHAFSFLDMNLKKGLLKSLKNNGFRKPFKIQQKLIMPLIEGKKKQLHSLLINLLLNTIEERIIAQDIQFLGYDAIVESNWQSGRTVAAIIATLQRIDPKLNECQAVVITPRKEFALHIEDKILKLATDMNIKCLSCIGVQNITEDINRILMGTHIVVGTPSRVYDMINRKVLGFGSIKVIIFDEISELLETYFKYVLQIIEFFDTKIQIIFLSTSMSEIVMDLSHKIMREPLSFCDETQYSFNNTKQYYIKLDTNDYKYDTLMDLFEIFTKTPVIVFCNTRKRVLHLNEFMESKSLAVSYLHLEMDSKETYTIVEELNCGSCPVLVTTDYFSRILDLNHICLTVNFDLPVKLENYSKRIGNCVDIQREVMVINFVLDNEIKFMSDIENYYNIKIEKMPLNIDEFV